jgi:hypothetical protein
MHGNPFVKLIYANKTYKDIFKALRKENIGGTL